MFGKQKFYAGFLSAVLGVLLIAGASVRMHAEDVKPASAKPAPIHGGGAIKPSAFVLPEDYPYEDVEIMMPDTVLLGGRLYDPEQVRVAMLSAAPSDDDEDDDEDDVFDDPANVTKYPLVILLHGLNGTQQDWGNFPETLVKKGYAVLALDLRGHGASDRNIRDRKISWRKFNNKQWDEMPRAIERVVRYLATEQEYPQVDTKRVALVGSKLGGNVAIIAASRMPKTKALVTLSAGVNYKGLETSHAVVKYTNPLFVIASQQDIYSYESSELLYRWAIGVKKLQLYRQVGDGSEMLRHMPSLKIDIAQWLAVQMPPTPLPPK